MEEFLLGCDWGTSSFRLRLFDINREQVTGQITSDEGIAAMHRSWQNLNEPSNNTTKADFFRRYLEKQVVLLSQESSVDLEYLTIIISGMASSTIGMLDVPYANLPFALDGSNAIIKRLHSADDFPHEIILISGARSENDVMRGEETQLIGLSALLEQSGTRPKDGVFIFPGTHSKHMYIKNGSLINFNTYMTGEVFNIMSNHSILKDSIQKDDEKKLSQADADAFKLGVQKSKETGILNGLFTVRTNQLFNKLDKKQNFFYLSGLLIGEEMNYLLRDEALDIFVCSASNLNDFYKMAIEELNLSGRTSTVSADLVDKAALAGQNEIFQRHILNK